jgi:ketosteroid isomerase-like protein
MKRGCIAGCVIGLSILLGGCSDTPAPAPDTSAADQKAIRDGEVAWAAEWGAKDLDKIVSHYADDASLMVPDAPLMKGKDAIRTGIQGILTDKNVALTFTTSSLELSKGADLAYTQGTYSMTASNPRTKKPETARGEYVTVYKKQATGNWKAVQDIVTEDGPPAPVAAAKVAKKIAPVARKKKRK